MYTQTGERGDYFFVQTGNPETDKYPIHFVERRTNINFCLFWRLRMASAYIMSPVLMSGIHNSDAPGKSQILHHAAGGVASPHATLLLREEEMRDCHSENEKYYKLLSVYYKHLYSLEKTKTQVEYPPHALSIVPSRVPRLYPPHVACHKDKR